VRAQVKRAALAAYVRVNADAVRPFTILLTTDRKLRTLNANFRGKDKPTNVLSFPSDDPDYLGDIAIAYGVAAREAKAEGKSFAHHAAHLAVHGVLHLLGFDHERPRDARLMEPLEIEILAGLKIPNPYLSKAA
jgi:probable rRNA maturation factor